MSSALARTLLSAASLAAILFPAGMASAADAPGCKDPAGLKRFQGSTLFHCDNRNLAETSMATGKMTQFLVAAKKGVFQSELALEGKRSVAAYALPKGASSAEAWRNYKLDLEAKGYKVLWEAKARDLGQDFGYQYMDRDGFQQIFGYSNDTGRYGVAVRVEGGRKSYVSVYAIEFEGGVDNIFEPEKGQVLVRLEVIETSGAGDPTVEATPAPTATSAPTQAPASPAPAPAAAPPLKSTTSPTGAALPPRSAPASMPGDAQGCFEPAGLKRYPGSKLVHCDNRDFDEVTFGTGKMTAYDFDLAHPTYDSQVDAEGRNTVSTYALPRGTTPADAWSSYGAALETQGFKILYAGTEPDIGSGVGTHYQYRNGLEQTFAYSGDTGHYGVAVKDEGGRQTYVSVYALKFQGGVTPGLAIESLQTLVRVQALETSPLAAKMTVAAPGPADAGGCKDPVSLKRFLGSTLVHCENRNFAEVTMGTGKMTEYLIDAKRPVFESQVDLEGRSTVSAYVLPMSTSPADAWRNYRIELESQGFTVLYEGRDRHMGESFGYQFQDRNGLAQTFAYSQWGRYGIAVKDEGSRKTYVSVYAIEYDGGVTPSHIHAAKRQTLVRLETMETGKLEDKMALVDAGAIEKSIADTGKIAIYGINFDFNKSDIKPESRPVLDEIGKFLKSNPGVRLDIVGHTDGIGGADFNMRLSQARAIAVVNDLISVYGISPRRLASRGAGLAKPIAPNDTDEGRAKNRRVELVKL